MLRSFLILFVATITLTAQAQTGDTTSVYFERNIDKISNDGRIILDALIQRKHILPTDQVYIIGYADYLGNEERNQSLSEARANNVADYLITAQSGLQRQSIKMCVGRGQVERFVDRNADGYPTDRRVDIVILNLPVQKEEPLLPQPGKTAKKTGRIMVGDPDNIRLAQGRKHTKDSVIGSRVLDTDPDNVNIVVKPGTHGGPPLKEYKKHVDVEPAKTIDIHKYKAGETIVLDKIYFYPESHQIRPPSLPQLEKLYEMMEGNPSTKIQIEGHVCCILDFADAYDIDSKDNQLSVNRAKFIYDYLISQGISSDRLKYVGFGRSRPIVAVEQSESDANTNRRVEIRILEK